MAKRKRPSKSWKQSERRTARLFGSERAPLSGSNGKITGSDALHPRLFIENKQRATCSLWTLFDDVKVLAKKEGKTPVIVRDRKRSPGAIVCVHTDHLPSVVTEYLRANPKVQKQVFAALKAA